MFKWQSCRNLWIIPRKWKVSILISIGIVSFLLYVSMTKDIGIPIVVKNYMTDVITRTGMEYDKADNYCHRELGLPNNIMYSERSRTTETITDKELQQIKRSLWTSPIVVPKYKLIFFQIEKNGCTQWKKLFQLIQNISRPSYVSVHDPNVNGLVYLNHYSDSSIRELILDREWTKATVVREPCARTLSAYLLFTDTSYPLYEKRISKKKLSFIEFLHHISLHRNVHWESQVRLPQWLYRNVTIGKFEHIQDFGVMLLKQIGAWNEWGHKWGPYRNETIFSSVYNKQYRRMASTKLSMYYTRKLEDIVFKLYAKDFKMFNYSCNYISNK